MPDETKERRSRINNTYILVYPVPQLLELDVLLKAEVPHGIPLLAQLRPQVLAIRKILAILFESPYKEPAYV